MKKIIYTIVAAAAMLFAVTEANAQMGKRYFINGGWQFNGTPGNEFVKSAQGYGAYAEGGYYVTPMFAVGGFANFNTNDEYIPMQTYTFSDQSALTTDLTRTLYQMPFGAMMITVCAKYLFFDILPDGGVIDLLYSIEIENNAAGTVDYHLDIRAK
jgi:hypothetical protein